MKLKNAKSDLKEMRESILEKMSIEQALQAKYRGAMRAAEDDQEFETARRLFDDSVEYWEILKKTLVEYDKIAEDKKKISPDTALVVAGNLAGILLILNFEKLDIVRSKAMSFVLKGRL